jgi:hypothetical protein
MGREGYEFRAAIGLTFLCIMLVTLLKFVLQVREHGLTKIVFWKKPDIYLSNC